MNKLKSFFIFALFVMAFHAKATEIKYECPREIHTEQSPIKDTIPQGWIGKRDFNFEPQLRTNLEVYDGNPEGGASLVPDNEMENDSSKVTWTFNKKKDRSIWLACQYLGTRIMLTKELPIDVTSCRLLLQTDKKSKAPIGIICKKD